MNDDRFLERLRDDAPRLRYQPDDVLLTRLTARVRERVASQPTVESFLARWFRPLAMSLGVLAPGVRAGTTGPQPGLLQCGGTQRLCQWSVDASGNGPV